MSSNKGEDISSSEVLFIRGGRVVDPAHDRDGEMDVHIQGDKIFRVGKGLPVPTGATVMDAKGCVVTPGFVDMHVHLREPGNEGAETIETGTRAAAAGGVTSVVAMPNTEPAIDNVSGVRFILRRAAETAAVRVWPAGAITKGRAGETLAEIGAMAKAGCVAVTDDGASVKDSRLLRRAMEYAKVFDLLVIEHSEDHDLMADGVMNEGALATRIGYRGIPRQAESIAVGRNIALAELTGARLHLAHISTRESVELIRAARKKGLKISAEVAPHHFTLTEDAVLEYGSIAKMNPPLRAEEDRAAVLEALADGTLDVIATDHAPHTRAAKEQEFSAAPFGIIGLETLLPLVVKQIIEPGLMTWTEVVKRASLTPARLLKLPVGHLGDGAPADVAVIDPSEERKADAFVSKSRNSPFLGWNLRGFPRATIVGGKIVFQKVPVK